MEVRGIQAVVKALNRAASLSTRQIVTIQTTIRTGAAIALAAGGGLSKNPIMHSRNGFLRTLKWLNAIRRAALNQCWRTEARLRGVELTGHVLFNGRPCLARIPGSRIVLADGVTLNSYFRSNPIGCSRPATLRTLRPGAGIVLERLSGISGSSVCAAVSVRIGEGTIIGADALLLDNDFHAPNGQWG